MWIFLFGHFIITLAYPAAEKCCPSSVDCCSKAIQNRTRLNLCFSDLENEKAAADCIQKQLFGEISLQFGSINDTECCSIFEMDDNDAGGHCLNGCQMDYPIPTISPKIKLEFIRHCRQDGDRDMYKCFRRCQIWKRTYNDRPFPVYKQCNLAAMMHEKIVYLGEELPPRVIEK